MRLSMNELREATPEDFERILALEKISFSTEDGRFSRRQLHDLLYNPRAFWLLGADGGAVACWLKAGNRHKHWARLYSLAVHPDLRGEGWAERLIRAGFVWMKRNRLNVCRAEVREDNHAARRLYARLGFEEIAVLKNYYGQKRDGVRLIKKLQSHRHKN